MFKGSFQKNSAQDVIQRDGQETHSFLKNLVTRSLIQSSCDQRYVVHSLIRQFLTDLNEEQFLEEKEVAQGLMVWHFLKLCHSSVSFLSRFDETVREFHSLL